MRRASSALLVLLGLQLRVIGGNEGANLVGHGPLALGRQLFCQMPIGKLP